RLRFLDEMGNAAELRLRARRDDHAGAAAPRHGGALEHHRRALGDPNLLRNRLGRLVDWHRLARQGRLVSRGLSARTVAIATPSSASPNQKASAAAAASR